MTFYFLSFRFNLLFLFLDLSTKFGYFSVTLTRVSGFFAIAKIKEARKINFVDKKWIKKAVSKKDKRIKVPKQEGQIC